jgi:CRP-like cAMP-binding protein
MEQNQHLLEMLKKVNVFSDFDDKTLHLVQEKIHPEIFNPGDVLCREGDTGDRMFIIESGEISVLKQGDDDSPVEIAVLQSGEIAGELSLFGRTTRSATLRARTQTGIWVLDYDTFQELLDQHGTLSMALLAKLSDQLRRESSVVAKLLSSKLDHYEKSFWKDVELMAKSHYRPRLTVYVVWHPDYQEGQALADYIYSRLTRDVKQPISRGLGIPVFFRNTLLPEREAPLEIDLDDAQHSAVVVLVDDNMVVSESWEEYVADLWQQMQVPDCPHRLYPVSVSPQAFNLESNVPEVNFIRLHDLDELDRPTFLMSSLVHELCRLLLNRKRLAASTTEVSAAPVKLFISHAKRDGLDIAEPIRDYIHQNTALKTFFDATDIAPGHSFAKEITSQLADAALLAIQTDAYVSREWCQREIITAKRLDRPIVVVNAIREGEERGFPYIGNVPTIRWHENRYQDDPQARNAAIQAVLDLMLYEVLKDVYLEQHFEDLRSLMLIPEQAILLSRPPELLSLLNIKDDSSVRFADMILYPDPPLGDEEIKLLTSFSPGTQLKTPTLLWR